MTIAYPSEWWDRYGDRSKYNKIIEIIDAVNNVSQGNLDAVIIDGVTVIDSNRNISLNELGKKIYFKPGINYTYLRSYTAEYESDTHYGTRYPVIMGLIDTGEFDIIKTAGGSEDSVLFALKGATGDVWIKGDIQSEGVYIKNKSYAFFQQVVSSHTALAFNAYFDGSAWQHPSTSIDAGLLYIDATGMEFWWKDVTGGGSWSKKLDVDIHGNISANAIKVVGNYSSIVGGWGNSIWLERSNHDSIVYVDPNNNRGFMIGFHGYNDVLYFRHTTDAWSSVNTQLGYVNGGGNWYFNGNATVGGDLSIGGSVVSNISLASGKGLKFYNEAGDKIALYGLLGDNGFHGFGIKSSTLAFILPSDSKHYFRWYGRSSGSDTELMQLDTDGNLSFTGELLNALKINHVGGTTPNLIIYGSGEQTIRLYNTASSGSTRTSIKFASRLNTDWSWIIMTDVPGNGTEDLLFRSRSADVLHLYKNGDVVIGGDVQINGNDIKSGGGTVVITLGSPFYTVGQRPKADVTYMSGDATHRWYYVYTKYLHTGDIVFEERKCAICGRKFKKGDKIALYVNEIDEHGTHAVPIHDRCLN